MNLMKPAWSVAIATSALCLTTLSSPAQEPDQTQAPTNATVESTPATSGLTDASNAVGLRVRSEHLQKDTLFALGHDVELKAGEHAEVVVVIGGSATIRGRCQQCVVIGGDANIEGEVQHSTVAVLGGIKVGPEGRLGGDIVTVGGKFEAAPTAAITGHVQEIDLGKIGLPKLEWLKAWMTECVLKLRPLSPHVGWIWAIAGGFFLLYFLVALAFPRPVQVCVNELTSRPATTFLVGLLTKVLVPIVITILAMTGIGLLVVPVLMAALFFAAIIAKVALLEYFGGALGRAFGLDSARAPLLAFLAGAVLIVALYMVPIIGFITFAVLGVWGLGVAMTAVCTGMGRERRQRPPRATVPPAAGGSPGAPAPITPVAPAPAPGNAMGFAAADPTQTGLGAGAATASASTATVETPPQAAASTAPPVPAVGGAPLAGFWERMGAAFLDLALLSLGIGFLGPFIFIVALAYFAGMWAWKGTTIGGIVLKLRVVRYDGAPVTFLVALVRGLAAAFSAAVFFLGFFWIGWDAEKQGWHDKIAGTVVVRLPHVVPLVCV